MDRKWFVKIIEMLQQNWAIILMDDKATINFIDEDGRIFDTLEYTDTKTAEEKLRLNGFDRLEEIKEWEKFLPPPDDSKGEQVQGRNIYSSGEYWAD